MADKSRLYQEGNYGMKVFALTYDESGNATYGEPQAIQGLVNVDITFSRTRTKTAADDVVDYLNRTSPEKGDGTITLLGLSTADYQKLYNNIVDSKGVVVIGRKAQTKRLGVIFYNTENYEGSSSENMFVLPNVTFEMPNISTQTIAEDDTTIREFALTVQANAQAYMTSDNKKDRYTCAIVNSVDNADIYDTVKDTVYVPDKAVSL